MLFNLELVNRKKDILHTLRIKPLDTNLGRGWSALLRQAIDDDKCYLIETNRLYMLNDDWNHEIITSELNSCINLVNEYDNIIDRIVSVDSSQDDLNYLHTFFENLRGKDESPPDWYVNAPQEIQLAISKFNVLIHRYEGFVNGRKAGRIVVSYKNRPTREMTLEEKMEFSPSLRPGIVHLKYCHKGKTLWDVFKDEDEHIGDKNILPQHKISSDFNLNINRGTKKEKVSQFFDWLNTNKDYFNSIGIDIDDPATTKGFGSVGQIITKDYEDLYHEIYGVNEIYNITYNMEK